MNQIDRFIDCRFPHFALCVCCWRQFHSHLARAAPVENQGAAAAGSQFSQERLPSRIAQHKTLYTFILGVSGLLSPGSVEPRRSLLQAQLQ